MIWAKELGADVYYLEHRGYGCSLPGRDRQSLENLKYISSQQALSDIANFIKAINEYRPNSKWITFGCSYSGTLNAWFRQKYPEYTVGAVVSSAPMLPKINFFEYIQIIEKVFMEHSPKCVENIRQGIDEIHAKIYTIEGQQQLHQLFNIFLLEDNLEIKDLFYNLLTVIGGVVQQSQWMVRDICSIMMATRSPIENLSFIYHRWANKIQYFYANKQAMNTWMWQTCTEFGWFQTTDIAKNIFGSVLPLQYVLISFWFLG
uniref:Serine protease K12H4.7 n=1 Tax=Panagrolaimus davidi TaxID=227884 RepID=A0A914Q7Y1_9BILA